MNTTSNETASSPPRGRLPNAYLMISIFLTGGATLACEIAGTRMISPFHGSSLYTWSAVITVTLVSLALGYWMGGLAVDKVTHPKMLFPALCGLAGVSAALAPLLRRSVLTGTMSLGIQGGALVSAAVLIAPVLLFASALGPVVIRLRTESVGHVGRRSGNVYAISTLGSVLGAVVTGFWLIPNLGVSYIFFGLAGLLALIAATGAWLLQRRVIALSVLIVTSCGVAWGFSTQGAPGANVLFSKDSAYGRIAVEEADGFRCLRINGFVHSIIETDTGENVGPIIDEMVDAVRLNLRAERALLIGVGAGMLVGAVERRFGLTVDSVEIDPQIVSVARTFFGFAPRGKVFVEDGRQVLNRTEAQYDFVFLDAFGPEAPPGHLFTVEAFQAVKRAMKPNGIFVVNFVSVIDGEESRAWRSALRTFETVFPEVDAYTTTRGSNRLPKNIIVLATDSPQILKEHVTSERFSRRLELTPETMGDAIVMTDDYAPMEFLTAKMTRDYREKMQKEDSTLSF